MSATTANTQKAVKIAKDNIRIEILPIPTPGPDEVLIRNVAVASNPKDWKMPTYIPGYDKAEGNDVAGYIESVGDGVTEFKKGDKVAGFSVMMTDDKYAAYAQFTIVPSWTTFPLGPKTSFESASTLPLAAMTAAIGLYVQLGLPETADPSSAPVIIINGASSSVGSFAAQLAKIAGYKTVGTAGSGAAYAKECGINIVVDYRGKSDEELSEAIKAAVKELGGGNDSLGYSYDAVTEKGSETFIANAFPSGKGLITTILPTDEKVIASLGERGVEIRRTMVGSAHKEDKAFAERWYRQLGTWLEEGKFKGNRVKLIPGGLEGVKSGLELLQSGKVSAEKLVYLISDTPGLE